MKAIKSKRIVTSMILLTLGFSLSVSSCGKEDGNSETGDTIETLVNNYLLVATGQTTLYNCNGEVISSLSEGDALYGQDANYLNGSAMSFSNNSDGTITDNNTGLMWEEIPIPDGLTYDKAVEYCENLELAGYDDWRIPNLKELFSMSDFGSGWPYLDTSYFKLATGIVDKSEQYWSSNKYVGETTEGQDNAAFGVNHVTGHIKAYPARSSMDDMPDGELPPLPPGGLGEGTPPPPGGEGGMFNPLAKHVRAVRGDYYGINEFVDNGDSTITDNATGLMWTQTDNGKGLDWEHALSYAEGSEFAGYTDWRLPNVKELQGIVDYSYSPNATDALRIGPAINPIFSCTPIVSEAGYDDYPYFWTSTSACFTIGEPYYYAWYVAFGRAVDGDGEDTHGAGAVRFDTKYEGGSMGERGERIYNYVRLARDTE